MAITISRRVSLTPPLSPLLPLLPLLSLLLPLPVGAVDWLVQPSLRLRESYTDNALRAPPGKAQSDFITEIAPAIALIGTGPRLRMHLDYSWHKYLSGQRADTEHHELGASADAELVKDWFFIDADASVSRRNISPFGPQLIDDLPDTDNASTVRTTGISPYLRHRFRGLATTELRYTRNTVDSGGALLSVHSDEMELLLSGEPRGKGWTWNASHDVRRTQDSKLAPMRMQRSSVGLRYPFSSKWAATASGGTEKEGYVSASGKAPAGRFWSLGGVWTPSPRTSVAFSTGRRFFGNTYSLDATFLQRHTNWQLNYSENITTLPTQFSRLGDRDAGQLLDQLWRGIFPNARDRRLRIDAFLRYANSLGPERGAINYFSHRYFLQKQLKLTMARATAKSTMIAGITAVDRTAQTASGIDSGLLPGVEFGSEDRTRQMSGNLGWSWKASSRTSLNANAGYASVRSLSVPRHDNNITVTAGYTRILQQNMTASIDVRHTRHASNRGGDYRENGVSATLTMQF
ncbi:MULTISPECIES: TIGR03016 family PEP-CTERM system-associated outer membrane protein [Janthinobacterium]|uniref:TIGR03016 family PEP-CTERM system-associated outer membrane protein n=1 Tax=Janthinobacterium TaxID=29580 RepID=UPI001C5BD2E4|nr:MULTISPECIES: TIGR03016 family PEP-CTERM system-associated outer membrane protein [Janthinobacterium]MBW3509389.1 TIGR03016 family PEP-CTERM system-associated outer membrane protein [Janthinobacterium sp. NKUCC06_STL]MCA1859508.1 TIGR03016 family PEP-CTERM system-associated outer membrane protein [Janthinobacterium lividum]